MAAHLPSGRVLIVSNRLPVSAQLDHGAVRLELASGGLATGLRRWHSVERSLDRLAGRFLPRTPDRQSDGGGWDQAVTRTVPRRGSPGRT
jgi:hypothetical protein